jgi:hypothetical protein
MRHYLQTYSHNFIFLYIKMMLLFSTTKKNHRVQFFSGVAVAVLPCALG